MSINKQSKEPPKKDFADTATPIKLTKLSHIEHDSPRISVNIGGPGQT